MNCKKILPLIFSLALQLAVSDARGAIAFESLYSFGNDTNATGANPYGVLTPGPDGNLYGATAAGGLDGLGTIFRITTNGTLTTLVSFNGTNGSNPNETLVVGRDGNLYGTTMSGGNYGIGTIFKVTTNGAFTSMFSFSWATGSQAAPLLPASDGQLYGTARLGGMYNAGVAYRLTTNGIFSLLVSFNVTNGYKPSGALVEGDDGNLYGTTQEGGAGGYYGSGTVFRMTKNGVLTSLVSFTGFNGNAPNALVKGSDGIFYGTTRSGGTSGFTGYGTVFNITTDGTFNSLCSFYPSQGYNPRGLLTEGDDGHFYGVTAYGGALLGYGSIFKITKDGIMTPVFAFAGTNGSYPEAGLVKGTNGELYGMTPTGGTNWNGTAFKITTNGNYTLLVSFNNFENGNQPNQTLGRGPDGDFYGTTVNGGMNGGGTVFKMTAAGALTTLYPFHTAFDPNGSTPNLPTPGTGGNFFGIASSGGLFGYGDVFKFTTNGTLTILYSFTEGWFTYDSPTLIQGRDGNLYGTMPGGGSNSMGYIFRLTTNGAFSIVYDFNNPPPPALPDGSGPFQLLQARDGNFYGTTAGGGPDGLGTIFRLTPSGDFTTLHRFALFGPGSGVDNEGSYPNQLLQGNDGNFYGTTEYGGIESRFGGGTIFKMTPAGTLTTLHFFSSDASQGYYPSSLLQGSDGNFYGTTWEGGTNNGGTVFKITSTGGLTSLHSFSNVYSSGEPRYPSGLAQGADGRLYGTTIQGGTNETGAIFRMSLDGSVTVLHSFDEYRDGSSPHGLVQGKDRNFYGTSDGGPFYGGTFFRLVVPPYLSITTQPINSTNLPGTTVSFEVVTEGAAPLTYQWRKNSVNLTNGGNISGANSSTLTLANLSQTDGGIYSVVITNSYGSLASSNAWLVVLPPLPEALNATNLAWNTGGDAEWVSQVDISHDGVHAGQSGSIFDLQSSWLETTVNGPGTLTFWWKVSSEDDYDVLDFFINGALAASVSGNMDWQQGNFTFGAGGHTLRWVYSKDVNLALGADCAWLDQVTFAPTDPAIPVFHPVVKTGNNLAFTWSALPGRDYQLQYKTNVTQANWSNFGSPIAATNTTAAATAAISPEPQRFYRVVLLP